LFSSGSFLFLTLTLCLMIDNTEEKGWTEESLILLKKLVEIHKSDWTTIGRTMGRLNCDCRDRFQRLQPRTNSGKFTAEEDAEMAIAVRNVLNLPNDVSPANILVTGNISIMSDKNSLLSLIGAFSFIFNPATTLFDILKLRHIPVL
jgi:hypothetical protein